MAKIVPSTKPLSVSPLKVSQPVGASLAFLGLAKCMPLEHGARGCTSFNKLFFMRHFREPIPLQTTAMDHIATVIGADANIVEALSTIAVRNNPEIVGLITTGLSATQGADIEGTIRMFRSSHPEYQAMAVVPVSCTDTQGCLESGFALAVEAMVEHLVPAMRHAGRRPRQINVLASSMMTPADLEAVREWIIAFNLEPLFLPNIGDSLDGHLIEAGYSTLTYGGTTLAQIAVAGESLATLVIGPSLVRAAELLHKKTGVPNYLFDGLMGLKACDTFIDALSRISERTVPETIERQRAQLLDAMVDCQFYLGGIPVAIAADGDLLCTLTRFFSGIGAIVPVAVVSAPSPGVKDLDLPEVFVGDLEDWERLAKQHDVRLLVTNSHGAEAAARLDLPLLRAGFPLYDTVGGHSRTWVGYRGTRQAIYEIANLLLTRRRDVQPYHSRFWTGTARAVEVATAAAPCIV